MWVLEHSVHIEVEKPMCVDLEQADAVMAKAREKGVRVAVHHQARVGAFMRAMYKAFTEGRIGELRYISSRGKTYYGGLGLMNIGTHQLNNMLKFAGHCRTVSTVGLTDNHPITPEDVVPSPLGMGTIAGEQITATLHFDNNVTATLIQHRFPTGTSPVMKVVGTEGRLLATTCLLIKGNAWLLPQSHYIPDGKSDQWQPLEPVYPEHYDRRGTTSFLSELEAEVGKTVLTANQVTMWEVLRLAGNLTPQSNLGRLMMMISKIEERKNGTIH